MVISIGWGVRSREAVRLYTASRAMTAAMTLVSACGFAYFLFRGMILHMGFYCVVLCFCPSEIINGLHNPKFVVKQERTRDSKKKTVFFIFFQTCIEIPGGSGKKNWTDRLRIHHLPPKTVGRGIYTYDPQEHKT